MLHTALQKDIDSKWDDCWPMNSLRPLAILDLTSYLFFLKKLDEENLIDESVFKSHSDNFNGSKNVDELRWRKFKNLDAQDLHELFTKKNGIADSIKIYGQTDFPYSNFLKGPLLLTPTATLLVACIDIIKIIEAEDADTKSGIFEYLLNKAEIIGQNGQIFLPANIISQMVSLLQPGANDIIWDPCAGNGCLLVKSADYITRKKFIAAPNIENILDSQRFAGVESDLINVRIGAMNMILHGMHTSELQTSDASMLMYIHRSTQPVLIISNLFFAATEDKMTVEENTLKTASTRKEITFLNLILKSLKPGGRAVVIIPDVILYSNRTGIKSLRQQIIDNCKLEAVISVPGKNDSHFSGGIIMIFSEASRSKTDKVWFYKSRTSGDNINSGDGNNDYLEILNQWENREKQIEKNEAHESFYVTAAAIKNNNYNLVFNEYKMLLKKQQLFEKIEEVGTEKKNSFANTGQSSRRNTRKKEVKRKSYIKVVLIVLTSLVVCYLAYLASKR